MKLTFFINRPVFSIVLSILIVILGGIGLMLLPIDQYPQITPPVVKVTASYPGASALTVSQAVATPIEQELNGTPGMLYMESSSNNSGSYTATITFDISASPELSAVEVQNRVKLAESRLPAEVIKNGISVERQASSQLMTICITSSDPKFDEIYLSNYATLNVVDLLRRIPEVGRVSTIGGRYYAMQIWVQPDKLANMGITIGDLQKALQDQNRESAAGVLGQQPVSGLDVTMPITTQGRLSSVKQFEDIVVRADADGSIIRLRDVARISLEAQSYNTESAINGENAAVLAVYMLPGANALEVAARVKAAMEDISKNFPESVSYDIPFDMTTYISESVHEVYKTLFEALFLVIIVVFLSLQSWRATVIPLIAVPISLIGTFGFMLIFGFSLNILTLLGLVLAIGIVVDDAIVVVENVERVMEEEGLSPYEATKKTMASLSSPIIATSLVLAAVFVPVSFLPGITGLLYRQFSITIAVSVLLSAVVALTLSPVMCTLILKPIKSDKKKNVVFRSINHWLEVGNVRYVRLAEKLISHKKIVLISFAGMLAIIFIIAKFMPSSFLPIEDQGYFNIELELPEGATLERTRNATNRAVSYLMANPAVEYVQSVAGSSGQVGSSQSRSTLMVILKPWDERDGQTVDDIMAVVKKDLHEFPECKVYLSRPPVIPGLGSSGGFEVQLEAKGDASLENLLSASDTLMKYAQESKAITGLSSSLMADIPQLYFDVDRDKAKFAGVPLSDIFSTMKAFTGSVYVNDFNMFNRIYRVYIQAEAPYREHQDNINLFYVRGDGGAMIPLTSLGNAYYTTGAGNVKRFNMFTSAVIRGDVASGHSSGQAMEDIEEIVANKLPSNIDMEWSGLSFQEKQAGGQTGIVFLLVFMFVFLFLSALYESWTVPLSVLLSLPIAALGAYLGSWICGRQNDVYFQIGLVMLMGMAAKNAILIVEFAKDNVQKGVAPLQAALAALQLRFRPIVMTSLAFILGMVPMVISSGPGSESRQSIGTGVFFGMIFAVVIGLLTVPFFFVLIHNLVHRMKGKTATACIAAGILLASSSLTSCKIGHKYVRPDLDMPQAYLEHKFDSAAIAQLNWKTVYQDTLLQRIIISALENNKDILVSEARIKEMAARKRMTMADLLPRIDGQAYTQKEGLNYGGGNFKPDPEAGVKFTAQWELDLWGNLRWNRDQSIALWRSAKETQQALTLSIIADVASAYYELVALDNELDVVRQTLMARKESVRLTKLRYEGGLTSETSYQQAQVEYASTATLIPVLERNIVIKQNEIMLLMGCYPGKIERSLVSDSLYWDYCLPDQMSSQLVERRPDIRAAEQDLIAANAAVGAAYTNRFPRLALTAIGGVESDELGNLLKSPMYFLSAALTGPVFDMGKRQAEYRAKQAAYEAQCHIYEKTVLKAFSEVSNAITEFNKSREIFQTMTQLRDAAGATTKLASLQYINGVIAYLDLLDAQRKYFDAQIGVIHAERDRRLALTHLFKALGGGF